MEVRLLPPQPSNLRKEGIVEAASTSTVTVAKILENTSTLADMVKNVWDIMTSNPLLLVFICASLVTLGFSFYRKAKRAARG